MQIQRIHLAHTSEEWNLLEAEAIKRGHLSFREMFNKEIVVLGTNLILDENDAEPKCRDCDKRSNIYDIPPDVHEKIQMMSHKLCMPITSIIRYYITDQTLVTERLNKHF